MSPFIEFVDIDSGFHLSDENSYKLWLQEVSSLEESSISRLVYHFCSDDHLLKINKQFLNQDDYTDIISFPYSYDPIEAEIFISIDRVKDNAEIVNKSFDEELCRVLVHGLLHMCGYDDKDEEDKNKMRTAEDKYILYK